jgi:GDP-mannose 6-dehydrogenase
VDNSFHALKVTFGNEVGQVAAALGLDSHQVIEIFLSDTKLNISPTYLRPGFAFGGSCLPKDVRALTHTARQHDIDIPMLSNLLASNEAQIRRAVEMITSYGKRKIGIFGLSFKSGTDDLRESPLVELAERLTGKGYELQIFDSNVAHSRLIGANRAFLEERLPHISHVLTDDADAVLAHAEICVVATKDPQVLKAIDNARPDQFIIDLVRLPDAAERRGSDHYTGIAW